MSASKDYKNIKNPFQYLDAIDLYLLQGRVVEATVEFTALLQAMEETWSRVSYGREGSRGADTVSAAEICERGARQWQQILESDVDMLTLPLGVLGLFLTELHQLLIGSSQGHLDSYIKALHTRCAGNYKEQELVRLLLAWCPASTVNLNIFQFVKQAPDLVVAQAVATLACFALVTPQANLARNNAIALLANPEAIDIDQAIRFGVTGVLLQAWMRCSYSGNADKHRVKPFLTRMMTLSVARGLDRQPPSGKVAELQGKPNKPVLVVPLETFKDVHAMFRCYADVLLPMREHFYTVGLALTGFYNQGSKEVFDEFFDVGEICDWDGVRIVDIRTLVQTIQGWQPAALFYPSLGMSRWTIELAEHRLAPLQMMTIGHPATSMCSEIDYLFVESTYVGDHKNYSEKVVSLPAPSLRHRLPQGAPDVAPFRGMPSDGVIRIAIPSVAQKLTFEFIEALRYAEENAKNPVRFVFLLGVCSTQFPACERLLRSRLSNIEVWPSLSYQQYIEELNRCQLHAGTFPFGGTNSLIDSLRQGLPILALEGDQPHARIDPDFARRAGLPESFICQTEQQYGERLLELINDPQQLIEWRERILEQGNIDQEFLQKGDPEVFAQALHELVNEHNKA